MKKASTSKVLWTGIVGLALSPLVNAQTAIPPEADRILLSDPCAVFNVPTEDPNITRIVYGEDIDFDFKIRPDAFISVGDDGRVTLTIQLSSHGDGLGQTSGIKYVFESKALVSGGAGYDPVGLDPLDPEFVFTGRFKLDARIIGQGHEASPFGIAQGAQDNAVLHFAVGLRYAGGNVEVTPSDFALECVASPWSNLMMAPVAGAPRSNGVERGFGDPWNKYAWSMKDFNGGMVVGSKSAFYDITAYDPEADCGYMVTDIHLPLACMELYAAPNSGTSPASADTRFAEIWRYDYVKKTWTKVFDDGVSQGFRIMETHNGKLYAGSDLGAFITGVDLYSGAPGAWNFPGSQLLVSIDGRTFTRIASCESSGPCNHANGLANPYGIFGYPPNGAVNTSIRALASYKGRLYVGTFNAYGAELWAYNEVGDAWTRVYKFMNPMLPKAAIAELRVYKDKLYIGLAGPAGDSYLYRYDGTAVERVPGQPALPASDVGTLKLFVSSKGLLYIGNVDLNLGFYLQSYDGTSFRTITANGFYNASNAYAWSMAEVNGRVFVGTFNQALDIPGTLPRGPAELWYSDDSIAWQQMKLPLDWGLWNYGIRTMELGNSGKLLFLGSASNMVAPDLIAQPVPLGPGTEVWTIRATAVAPTGSSGR